MFPVTSKTQIGAPDRQATPGDGLPEANALGRVLSTESEAEAEIILARGPAPRPPPAPPAPPAPPRIAPPSSPGVRAPGGGDSFPDFRPLTNPFYGPQYHTGLPGPLAVVTPQWGGWYQLADGQMVNAETLQRLYREHKQKEEEERRA